jgi:GT2 family glycosyltransferase
MPRGCPDHEGEEELSMMSKPRISTIILTYRRDDALADTIARLHHHLEGRTDHEIILVDNNADGTDRDHMLGGLAGKSVTLGENLGVTGGRNAGIEAALGDILVFLDDDSLVEGEVGLYDRLASRFDEDPQLAAIAFRSWLREKDVSDPTEFPHTDKSFPRDMVFETFRFIGAGHAIRKSALDEVGLYPESFFYGMEEFELSFRLMKAGYRIVYDPSFTVTHMKADNGRLVRKDVIERMYANKLFIAWRHLPLKEALLCAGAWAVKTMIDSRDPRSVLRAFLAFTKNARREKAKRQPSRAVVNRIHHLGGTAWR